MLRSLLGSGNAADSSPPPSIWNSDSGTKMDGTIGTPMTFVTKRKTLTRSPTTVARMRPPPPGFQRHIRQKGELPSREVVGALQVLPEDHEGVGRAVDAHPATMARLAPLASAIRGGQLHRLNGAEPSLSCELAATATDADLALVDDAVVAAALGNVKRSSIALHCRRRSPGAGGGLALDSWAARFHLRGGPPEHPDCAAWRG